MKFFIGVVFILCLEIVVDGFPDKSLVISSTSPPDSNNEGDKQEEVKSDVDMFPKIYELDIQSNISNRFARTLVKSKVKNPSSSAKEATFSVILPDSAFISEFVMEIGGKSYKAHVKAKEEAKQEYDEAKSKGLGAAHVAVSARDSNRFTVSVNVEPQQKAVFLLTYEELLQRQNGQYESIINIHPGQIVKDLNVQVNINESRPLRFVRTPSLRSGNEISKSEENANPKTDIKQENNTAVVLFHPDVNDQQAFGGVLGSKESEGLNGQFVVQYDVEQDPQGGEVLIRDGYFVHFFSPSDLQPLPKQVVFVLDTSGSMSGSKIDQLRDSLIKILDDIRGDNLLSIIDFNSDVTVWDIVNQNYVTVPGASDGNVDYERLKDTNLPPSISTSDEVIEKAKNLSKNLTASTLTNMISGLKTALKIVRDVRGKKESKYQPLIIFLTDGHPTSSSTEAIIEEITKLNSAQDKIPIFSLSFGEGTNKKFLREFSAKNGGFSKHIYEASDASIQLQRFFHQISSPLLSDVKFKYESDVEETTKTVFPIYFKGSDMVVSGKIDTKNFTEFKAGIDSTSASGHLVLKPRVIEAPSSIERLWAYLTVKQALQDREYAENKEPLTKKALDIALRYSFVTDVTSLIVVKPNETSAVETENAATPGTPKSQTGYSKLILRGGTGLRLAGGGKPLYSQALAPEAFYPAMTTGHRLYSHATASQALYPALTTTVNTFSADTLPFLPWLTAAQNPNGTITVPQGTFEVGLDASLQYTPKTCPINPVTNSTGTCNLLKDCPEVHTALTDFETYKKYFCQVDSTQYAGVCCPIATTNTTSTTATSV